MEMFQNQILHTQWQALESPLERLAGSILHTSEKLNRPSRNIRFRPEN